MIRNANELGKEKVGNNISISFEPPSLQNSLRRPRAVSQETQIQIVPLGSILWDSDGKNFVKDDIAKQLMELENVYPENSRLSEEEKRAVVTGRDTLKFVARENDLIVGFAYGASLTSAAMREVLTSYDIDDYEHDNFAELDKRFAGREHTVFYHHGIEVSEKRQGMGIGEHLLGTLIGDAAASGYEYFVGFAREGASARLYEKFGATKVKECPNFYDSGETHYLMEIKLKPHAAGNDGVN